MKLPRILLLLALAAPGLAGGETLDRPERIARLSYVEGEMVFQAAEKRATTTLPRRPLEPGDRIATEAGSRAELALGTATVRLDGRSELVFAELDEAAVRIELESGTASVSLGQLLEDERFDVVTPNATITLDEPGEYRVDVRGERDSALTVHEGAATVATADGPVRVAAGQRVRIEGRDALARLESPRVPDAFDDWVLEREVMLADAEPPRYTPYEGGGYDELDRYGDWYDEPRYGRVWMPGYGYTGWSPYGDGYWLRSGFGWSWYDPAPWGYFSYYDGRWLYLRDRHRWAWMPAPRHRPRHRDRDDDGPSWYPRAPEVPESGPRTADHGSNAGSGSGPVTIAPSMPRRIDPDRSPPRATENSANDRPRGGTYAPRGEREPRQAAPVARPAAPSAAPRQSSGAPPASSPPPSSPPPARTRSNPDSPSRISREPETRQEP